MLPIKVNRQRLIIILSAVTILTLLIYWATSNNSDEEKPKKALPTTTTTLPPKDAQACEYLTEEALLAGGIIPDVEPTRSKNLRRCTFEDIGSSINYITLYVDERERCGVLLEDSKEQTPLKSVAPNAVYIDELDPTIIVPLGDRCFFLQGSKTIVAKNSLTQIAKHITNTFRAVDATTTTVTSTTVVLPVDTNVIPGVNRATTAPETTTP